MKLAFSPCSLVFITDVKVPNSPCISFSLSGSAEVETVKEVYFRGDTICVKLVNNLD